MSVLESLKGTFHSVQQDIFDGLRALTSLEAQPRSETFRRLVEDGVNLDAGADVLHKFQNSWAELHEYTTETAKRAEEVDSKVNQLYLRWEKESENFRRLEAEIRELPALLSTISSVTDTLAYLQDNFRHVENSLERLEDVVEEQELDRNRKSHQHQLSNYRHLKLAEVERVKVKLARDHARKMADIERSQQSRLKERREAFQEAFSEDVSFYRSHGKLERVGSKDMPKVSSLSEITLEDDPNALNDFLSSNDPTPVSERPPGAQDEMEDNGHDFIEDDYTEDYKTGKDEEDSDDDNNDDIDELISRSRAEAAADFERTYSSSSSLDKMGKEDGADGEHAANAQAQAVPSYVTAADESKGVNSSLDDKGENSSEASAEERPENDPVESPPDQEKVD